MTREIICNYMLSPRDSVGGKLTFEETKMGYSSSWFERIGRSDLEIVYKDIKEIKKFKFLYFLTKPITMLFFGVFVKMNDGSMHVFVHTKRKSLINEITKRMKG